MVEIASYGPWAVVTGASSGIGRAFAEHLAAAGVNVVLASRSTDRLQALGASLRGVAHRVVTVDLSTESGAAALLDATADLDVGLLVSNAGGGRPGRFLEQDLDDLHGRLMLNATSHLNLAYGFGRRFVERGRGGIVLVSAHGALQGLPNMAHESAAKAYVLNLGESLHYELAPAGINVMVLLPGNVDTPIIETFGLDRASLPVKPMPAAAAVSETVAAFLRGRPMHIPGRLMRVMTRIVPRSRMVRLNGRMLGQAARNLSKPSLA
jgi:short-subunit dehydrogenase